MGDFNAKVGSRQNDEEKESVGPFGLGDRNERGEQLVEFVTGNDLVVANTFFQQHPRRLFTWTHPDGVTKNQIDSILAPRRWRSSAFNVKTLPVVDCSSDHELLSAYFKIKLKKVKQEKTQVRYDVSEDQCRVQSRNPKSISSLDGN